MLLTVLLAVVGMALWLCATPSTASATYCYYPAMAGGDGSFWTPDLYGGGFYESAVFSPALGVYRDNFSFDYGGPTINATDYNNPKDFGCHSESHGQQWAMPTETIDGVDVTPKSYADRKRPFGRSYVALKNSGATPVTFDLTFNDTLGTGTETNIDRTSSGDDVGDPADKSATICDDPDADGCKNVTGEASRLPEIADNWEGKGKVKDSADAVTLADGSQDATIAFQGITLKPGQEVAYMEIASLGLNIDQARQEASKAANDPQAYGVFRGLSKAERKRLRNW